ncbi:DUF6493 family protein [Streptomyces sp. ME02-6979.5a]|uniref:DUF7825 domain-containing protein n=1 Tax=Streptomyces sp. ME02-6979.5a TaxID=462925 RepID=UPI0029B6C4AF|nr:DUF6493 family protein [Streptomyces sp. ME02-6979.5a]MDX3341642.1 DUF6493 family protein [Streptomyces sp. ME02-6979.5a]
MNELLTAVRAGRHHEVPPLVLALDRPGRRAALAELKELRKEVRGWDWQRRDRIRKALLVAGAGCHTGAAGCAAWIGGRDLRDWTRSPYPLILASLKDRDPEWLGDLAHRFAGRAALSDAEYTFVGELTRIAGVPLPVTDNLVVGWAELVGAARWRGRTRRPLTDILRDDPHTAVLASRLFEMSELPPQVDFHDAPDSQDHWPGALCALADDGVLDRAHLVERCVTRLMRGGKSVDQRFFLAVLLRLGTTEEEEDRHLRDWTAMAADGIAPVASHAQQVLVRLDARGVLSTRELADVSGAVLFRQEKKLVRAQLTLLGKALRRDASTAGELLPAVAEAFGHEAIDVQERALKLVARYLPGAEDPGVREQLASAAGQLGPLHRESVAALFGDLVVEAAAGAYEEFLPPAPVLRPLEPAPETVAELVEEVAARVKAHASEHWIPSSAVMETSDGITGFERALDGLVRLARTDREELTGALREALAGVHFVEHGLSPYMIDPRYISTSHGLSVVAASLLGLVSERDRVAWRAKTTVKGADACAHAALNGVLLDRVWEAVEAIAAGRAPFLVATPTWHTGAIEAAELVERLRAYQELGACPGPADFAQALLRVRRNSGPEGAAAAAAAEALGTGEGDRLAAWIRADEPVAPVLRHPATAVSRPSAGNWWQRTTTGARQVLLATRERLVIQREFPEAFHWLGRAQLPHARECYHWGPERSSHWTATLPEDPETLAAWLLPDLLFAADQGQRGAVGFLPALAESAGAAGGAMHLALAYGLGARHPEDRTAAVDALLVLAARGRLDGASLGRELAILVDRDLVKVNRTADALGTAAATGAYRTVLTVLAAMLPGLLAYEKTPRGLGDLLSVAAGCAERCGTDGIPPIAGLAATAGRKGSSQTVRQAARLLAAFPAGVEESTPEATTPDVPSPMAVGPEAVGPEAVGPQAIGPQASDAERKDQGMAGLGI